MGRPDFEPLDPDYQERTRETFDSQAMMHTMGIELVDLGPGWVHFEFDHDDRFTQQDGFYHAGAVATALDSACGFAGFSLMPVDASVLTVEYKINLLRPAKATRYKVEAEVTKTGRTLTVCQGTASPAEGGDAISIMTATLISLTGR